MGRRGTHACIDLRPRSRRINGPKRACAHVYTNKLGEVVCCNEKTCGRRERRVGFVRNTYSSRRPRESTSNCIRPARITPPKRTYRAPRSPFTRLANAKRSNGRRDPCTGRRAQVHTSNTGGVYLIIGETTSALARMCLRQFHVVRNRNVL